MTVTIESKASKDGKTSVSLEARFQYGVDVYQAFVYKTYDGYMYHETNKSYPTGDKKKAKAAYNRFCNKYIN